MRIFVTAPSLLVAFSIATAARAERERAQPSLDGLAEAIIVPVALGDARWGAAEITKGVRTELMRAVGALMKPEKLIGAQAQILASHSIGELETLELNTAAYLSRAGRLTGARYIVRLSVTKTRQGYEPVAAIIDVDSSAVVEAVRVGAYRKVQSSKDKGRALGRAVVRALRAIRLQDAPGMRNKAS